jgi:hypothetical protein
MTQTGPGKCGQSGCWWHLYRNRATGGCGFESCLLCRMAAGYAAWSWHDYCCAWTHSPFARCTKVGTNAELWQLRPMCCAAAAAAAVAASCLTLLQPAPKPIGTCKQAMQCERGKVCQHVQCESARCDCLPLQEDTVHVTTTCLGLRLVLYCQLPLCCSTVSLNVLLMLPLQGACMDTCSHP